jgi:hypothetical protein
MRLRLHIIQPGRELRPPDIAKEEEVERTTISRLCQARERTQPLDLVRLHGSTRGQVPGCEAAVHDLKRHPGRGTLCRRPRSDVERAVKETTEHLLPLPGSLRRTCSTARERLEQLGQ